WINGDEIAANGFDDDGNGYIDDVKGWDFCNSSSSSPPYCDLQKDNNPDDEHGHGSHVAGIAAASGNNGKGIAGVSWQAKIMPVKVLDKWGHGDTYNLSQAIRYAADNGAQIINMSLGGGCGSGWPDVEDAVNYALSKGVLLVAASGNNGISSISCPAALNGVMAVGATTSDDQRAGYSNYGSGLDVVAPGSSIYSTYLGGGYTTMTGTSMATPHVAGLAALLWSFVPSYTDSQVRDALQNTVDDLGTAGWDQYFGYGRINARRALESVSLQTQPEQLTLLLDDETGSVSGHIQITTANPEPITWTAVISPAVTWLEPAPPSSGSVSIASPDSISVLATTTGITYATHTATVVVTGTAAGGEQLGPTTTQVTLHYVPQIYRYRLPFILKNSTVP
ncbi:MAG: S8 family serine peptidase, partial [Chloroflexota bacterium]